jgi:hypothetical protein
MKPFTRHQMLIAGILSVATGEATMQQYKTNADTVQLNITLNMNWLNRKKAAFAGARKLLHYYQLPDKNFCHISRDIWNLWQYLKIFFLFTSIPRFFGEPLKTFCRTMFVKHCTGGTKRCWSECAFSSITVLLCAHYWWVDVQKQFTSLHIMWMGAVSYSFSVLGLTVRYENGGRINNIENWAEEVYCLLGRHALSCDRHCPTFFLGTSVFRVEECPECRVNTSIRDVDTHTHTHTHTHTRATPRDS